MKDGFLSLLHRSLAGVLRLYYRVRAIGVHREVGLPDRHIIVANHPSAWDAVLLALVLPGRYTLVCSRRDAEELRGGLWLRLLLNIVVADGEKPSELKKAVARIRASGRCLVFPEGRVSPTGKLVKMDASLVWLLRQSKLPLVPVILKRQPHPRRAAFVPAWRGLATAHFSAVVRPEAGTKAVPSTHRRDAFAAWLEQQMRLAWYRSGELSGDVYRAFGRAACWHGLTKRVLEDWQGRVMSYAQLWQAAVVVSRHLRQLALGGGQTVACMLPNSTGYAVTLLALWRLKSTPALLNPTLGCDYLRRTLALSQPTAVITSRAFLERLGLEDTATWLEDQDCAVICLEDVKASIGAKERLSGIVLWLVERFGLAGRSSAAGGDCAAVLFTSGSEGAPKGVMLSHANILHNIAQTDAALDVCGLRDKLFNPLPMFHCFGLNVGCLMPLILGVPAHLYLTPLHYNLVPEAVYQSDATVLLGTNTFLRGYARRAHGYDFARLRMIVAGAEKLHPSTVALYHERFQVTIYEGYGATEAAPVISINTPLHNRPGAAGMLLPGIDVSLLPVDGIRSGCRLLIRGENVMSGYLPDDQHTSAWGVDSGWYDTGDIVELDEDGFVTIVDRAKRFAKVGGEMISLTAVERFVSELWPQAQHAVIAVPDEKTGERLVMVSEHAEAALSDLRRYLQERHVSTLACPIRIVVVEQVPLISTGKVDYRRIAEIVSEEGALPA